MKTVTQFIGGFCLALTLLAGTGCNTVSTIHTQDVGAPKFPPSDPARVQLVRQQPTRAHVRLGEVRAEPSSPSMDVTKIEEAIRKAAAKLGADAAVIVYDGTQTTGAVVLGPWWGRTLEPIQGRVIIAVAIKYQ